MRTTSTLADELLLADQGGTTSDSIDTGAFHFDGPSISFTRLARNLDSKLSSLLTRVILPEHTRVTSHERRSEGPSLFRFERYDRHPPVVRNSLQYVSGQDVARHVPVKTLVKAVCFKLAAKRGFGWLYRFRGLGKRALGGF